MPDEKVVLTGGALAASAARGVCAPVDARFGCAETCGECLRQARAALRAAVAAVGVGVEELTNCSEILDREWADPTENTARLLRALAEVVRDE